MHMMLFHNPTRNRRDILTWDILGRVKVDGVLNRRSCAQSSRGKSLGVMSRSMYHGIVQITADERVSTPIKNVGNGSGPCTHQDIACISGGRRRMLYRGARSAGVIGASGLGTACR